MDVWFILWPFSQFLPILVCCTKKNLATPNLNRFGEPLGLSEKKTFVRITIDCSLNVTKSFGYQPSGNKMISKSYSTTLYPK
jgi:hypothetical protein